MKYSEYTREKLEAMTTPRLLRFKKGMGAQHPPHLDMYEQCMFCSSGCTCVEDYETEKALWDTQMDLIRSVLNTREHVVRGKKGRLPR